MSYARFGSDPDPDHPRGSDVYLLFNTDQRWECCGCQLPDGPDLIIYETPSVEAFLHHLAEHQRAGQYVPAAAYEHIAADVREMADERAGITR